MITRIVHISDLHFPSRDPTVARLLMAEITRQAPDVLVITGDLVDHAGLGFKRYREVREWIRQVLRTFPEESCPDTIVLEGNHDVGIFGLVGLGWWRAIFRSGRNQTSGCWAHKMRPFSKPLHRPVSTPWKPSSSAASNPPTE